MEIIKSFIEAYNKKVDYLNTSFSDSHPFVERIVPDSVPVIVNPMKELIEHYNFSNKAFDGFMMLSKIERKECVQVLAEIEVEVKAIIFAENINCNEYYCTDSDFKEFHTISFEGDFRGFCANSPFLFLQLITLYIDRMNQLNQMNRNSEEFIDMSDEELEQYYLKAKKLSEEYGCIENDDFLRYITCYV